MKKSQQLKNDYSVHKGCAFVGVEVARRPRQQLFAGVLYYFNFHLRRVERKVELFDDVERQLADERDPESRKNAEKIYEQVLDTLVSSLTENYGRDEVNYALDMVTT